MQTPNANTVLSAKAILAMSLADVWNLPEDYYTVVYDDGEQHVRKKRYIIFDRYVWELYMLYPGTPIVSTCSAASVVGTGYFNADTHRLTIERVFKYIAAYNRLVTYAMKESLLKRIYEVIDLIGNEIVMNASPYVFTTHATDFVEVTNHPDIKAISENMQPTPEGVENAYRQIRLFVNSGKCNKNNFIKAYRAKTTNENQNNQCIGPRGFGTDLDRTVFRRPVLSGFIRGMSSLYELMVESCTAAKSLNATGSHIEQSEYTSRRIQLLSMVVTGVVDGDCGTNRTMPIMVTEQNADALKGKYYVHQDGGLREFVAEDRSTYSTVLEFRYTLGCRYHDTSKVCGTCLGAISSNFENTANLGYTATSHLMEKITSALLSTKHITHSVRKSSIRLEGMATKYFYSNDNGDLFFRPEMNLKGLNLILPNSKVGKLVDVLNMRTNTVGLAKIGELDTVYIRNMATKPPITETLNISYKDRCSVFTNYLLEYVRGCDLQSDPRGNFIVPLDNIDKRKPIFNNPLKESNIINFVNRIAAIIETNKDKVTDPTQKLAMLFETTLEQFKCNLFVLEILIYATTAFNAANGNYRLGRNSPTPYTEGKGVLFRNRDFAALASFEDQVTELKTHPTTAFGCRNKQENPMAVFFTPKEVVAAR